MTKQTCSVIDSLDRPALQQAVANLLEDSFDAAPLHCLQVADLVLALLEARGE